MEPGTVLADSAEFTGGSWRIYVVVRPPNLAPQQRSDFVRTVGARSAQLEGAVREAL